MSEDGSQQPRMASGSTSNSLSESTVNGPVLQVGALNGDVHVHSQPAPRAPGPEAVEILVEQRDPVGRLILLPALDDALSDPPVPAPGALTGSEDIVGWARAHGGVDFGITLLFVTVTNRSDTHLTLRAIRALILDRSEPMTGALVNRQTAGSSAVPELIVDLDRDEPDLVQVDEFTRQPVGARPYFDRTHVRLAPDESEKFIITAEIHRSCCTWQLGLIFHPDGGQEFLVQPPDRFRTTGLPMQGLAPVLTWQWHLKPPRFVPREWQLDWCRLGAAEPQPLPPLPEGVELPSWAAHPKVAPFLPALNHFLTAGTLDPEADWRLAAALEARKAIQTAARATADGSMDGVRAVRAAVQDQAHPAVLEQATVLMVLCHGLSEGRLPAPVHDGLRTYIERTPAANVLRPALASIERDA
ncbi:hypothetical protein E6W39_12910 [Kitasatospora acidiphila]|uniref:Uncharacterized protein n=1 Tax=Kitasatospora acidiphila TaxID=2567942 RepID=A0A540W204_9ACTN|nr:hypothetical protein [Kitasatospora acidiphila]TQF02997.1 hypothetical protein E6W39_12910 [Kitasatospora acidiphila]